MSEEKLSVLQDLFVDESHTLEDLKRLKDKSQDFFKIEKKTGKILIANQYGFTAKEKIILLLIGKYFCEEVGYEKKNMTTKLISEEVHIQQTSLTAPLGELVSQYILSKDGTAYTINYYQIEKQLDILNEKYILNTKPATIKSKINKQKSIQKHITKKHKYYHKKETYVSLEQRSEEKIKEYLEKEGLEKNDVYTVFNFSKNNLIILKGFKSQNNRESHIKATLLSFFAYAVFYDIDRIKSSDLRMILKNSGVPGINNLSTSLKIFNSWIIHERGKIGSTATHYRIVPEGQKQAIILFKDIINHTSSFNLGLTKSKVKSREIAPELNISKESLRKNISEFAKIEQLDETKLLTAFDFQEDHIRIIEPIKVKVRKKEQIKNLLLLGYIIKKVYKQDKFNCYTLLKNSSINSDRIDLLDTNKAFKKYFSLKKPKSAMSLIYSGEIKAKDCLEKYLSKESFEL